MTIELYYMLGSHPCRSVLLIGKLLGIKFELKEVELSKQEQLSPEFIKINPQHTIPTIVDDGFSLWESNAILTYLVEKYGKESLYPKDIKQRALIDQRCYFNVGTLTARLGDYYYPIWFGKGEADPVKLEKLKDALQFLDTFVTGQEYVAGNTLSVADISLVATVATLDVAKFDLSPYKNLNKWYSKVQKAVPGYEEINGKETLTKHFKEKYGDILKI